VVSDARPPEGLVLPFLPAHSSPRTVDRTLVWLRGAEATPARALARLGEADAIELHVHGLLDPELSDAAALALSPDPDGEALLTTRRLAGLQLPRHPGVTLAACWSARSLRTGRRTASLPSAFRAAGAAWVLAAAVPIGDAHAGEVFAAIEARIRAGAPPAVALREARQAAHGAPAEAWIDDVVLFE
jgi:hypothetical protein